MTRIKLAIPRKHRVSCKCNVTEHQLVKESTRPDYKAWLGLEKWGYTIVLTKTEYGDIVEENIIAEQFLVPYLMDPCHTTAFCDAQRSIREFITRQMAPDYPQDVIDYLCDATLPAMLADAFFRFR